jgi:hypothetical protein
MNVVLTINGVSFNCSARQSAAIQTLLETNKGGFARVNGYVSKTGRETPQVSNLSFISRFNLEKLYERKIKALRELKFEAVEAQLREEPKLNSLNDVRLREAFAARVNDEIASMEKTLAGVRDDARRESHDRNYLSLGAGVKVHFVTDKGDGGLMYPVTAENGLPTVKNIMVSAIEVSRNVLTEGAYKPVNSGVPKLISNVLNSHMPKSCKLKTLSLADDNFESLHIDGEAIMPKDIAGDFSAD